MQVYSTQPLEVMFADIRDLPSDIPIRRLLLEKVIYNLSKRGDFPPKNCEFMITIIPLIRAIANVKKGTIVMGYYKGVKYSAHIDGSNVSFVRNAWFVSDESGTVL